jgi:hypothetical protein
MTTDTTTVDTTETPDDEIDAALPTPEDPDTHAGLALQLMDRAQALADDLGDDEPELQMMATILAANTHAVIALYELMRRAATTEGIVDPRS